MEERLQKILARCGVASRRKAEELMSDGAVSVNGTVVRELGSKADLSSDLIEVRGYGRLTAEGLVYVLMNKPQKVVTTVDDPVGRTTVLEVLDRMPGHGKGPATLPRLYPVGRLDFDSEGALLLTNDGELANRLMHPRYGVSKTYHVKVKGLPDDDQLEQLRRGIRLPDMHGKLEKPTAPAEVELLRSTSANAWLAFTIHEGRHHQVRRMCERIGHDPLRVIRMAYGPILLGALQPGEWRFLSPDEVRLLSQAASEEKRAAREKRTRTMARRTPVEKKPASRRKEFIAHKRRERR
jgi:23S rRNA pseudouridine2605 synthase